MGTEMDVPPKRVLLVGFVLFLGLGGVSLYLYLPKVEVSDTVSITNGRVIIGLIADTHVPDRADGVPRRVFDIFNHVNVDYILHAGDITSQRVIDHLEAVAPVIACAGNHDNGQLRERYPEVNSVEVIGWRIGVWHNTHLFFRKQRAVDLAHKRGFDILVVGHIHKQEKIEEQGVLIVNPGSPVQPLPPLLVKATVAILTIEESYEVEFVKV
ncbi:MAG: YfcE family phosphodiesterase [Candidatus Korarchaeota archaeon]|nr:YfcE family phosphodiesterase [Candidatus Korarchaeota archaeon]